MPEITVFDRKGHPVRLESVGRGLYEEIRVEGGETIHTGNTVNLKSALACNAYFTEEQHERFLARQAKRKGKG